jgi:hypothetical protein
MTTLFQRLCFIVIFQICKYELILLRMLYNNCYWVLLDQVTFMITLVLWPCNFVGIPPDFSQDTKSIANSQQSSELQHFPLAAGR